MLEKHLTLTQRNQKDLACTLKIKDFFDDILENLINVFTLIVKVRERVRANVKICATSCICFQRASLSSLITLILLMPTQLILANEGSAFELDKQSRWTELRFEFAYPRTNTPQKFQVSAEGSFLINDYDNLVDFYRDGEVKTIVSMPEDLRIVSFAYLPIQGWYVVCAIDKKKKEEYTKYLNEGGISAQIPPIYKTIIYNELGDFLGYGHDARKPESDLFFYQLIIAENKLFINSMNLLTPSPTARGLLQELEIVQSGDSFLFEVKGVPFSSQERESAMREDYRYRWILTPDVTKSMVVIDELQPRTQVFSFLGDGKYSKRAKASKPINLPNRRAPFESGRKILQKRAQISLDSIYDHSLVVGAYQYGAHFLIGYTRPNPAHRDFEGLDDGVIAIDGAKPFILNIQRVDTNYKNTGSPLEREGAFLMGVYEMEVYVYHPEDQSVETLDLENFSPGK